MSKSDLQQSLREAMLQKDTIRVSVLRMLLSAINYYEIQKGGAGYEATAEDVLSVIEKEVKQHRDSIEQFKTGNRGDLVEKEQAELSVLEKYLPEQMSEADLQKLVDAAVTQTGAKTQQDMGKVMGYLMPNIKGKADGTLVSRLVKEKLTSANA